MRKLIGILIFLLLPVSLFGVIYYVDASRPDDSGDGLSEGAAWKTLAKVSAELNGDQSDDIIKFKKGEEWREQYTTAGFGTSGHLFTHSVYGTGANPIINGADLKDGAWNDDGGDEWTIDCAIEPNVVWFDDTLGTPDDPPGEEYEWDWDAGAGGKLTVWSDNVGGPNAEYTSPGVEAGARSRCVYSVGKSYVKYEYLTIRHSNVHGFDIAGASTYCEFDNLLIEYNQWRNGFQFTGNGTDYNTVTNSVARYNGEPGAEAGGGFCIFYEASNNLFEDCESHHNSEDGFAVGGGTGEATCGGINNIFRRCDGHDNQEDGFDIKQGPNLIDYCTADSNVGAGIVFHQFAEQMTIRYNIFTNCYHGIRSADGQQQSAGGDNIYYNIVTLHPTNGNTAIQHNANGPVNYYNNVLIAPSLDAEASGWSRAVDVPTGANDFTFKNNIVHVTDGFAMWLQEPTDTFDIDNNCYYQVNDTDIWKWGWIGSYDRTEIGDWRTASGGDDNSFHSDPVFVTPGSDFHLQVGSPCKNTGINVGLTLDYDGMTVPQGGGYDVGAYEYLEGAVLRIREILRIRNILRIKEEE